MREVLLVARHEFFVHLRRRSYVLTTVLLPVLGIAASLVSSYGGAMVVEGFSRAFEIGDLYRARSTTRVGFVDPGGFVQHVPEADPDGDVFVRLSSDEAARAALRAREVDLVYRLPPDYPDDRTIVRMSAGLLFVADDRQPINRLLYANLLDDLSPAQLALLTDPLQRVEIERVEPTAAEETVSDLQRDPLQLVVPVVFALLLYISIFMASSFLLQSVTTEKENRLVEILLTSLEPTHLLAGKILGLGLLGWLQLMVWAVTGAVLASVGGLVLTALALLRFGPLVLGLMFAYFVLGYLFYASLMGAIGALVPSFQESGPLTFVVLFPAWIPFFVLELIMAEPNGTVARALSLFPPTAPLVMMLRVARAEIAAAEIALSLLLILFGALVVLAVAGRLFRATVLLRGGIPGPRELYRALR